MDVDEETGLAPDEHLPCEWLPRDELVANTWNPNEMDSRERELLRRSIEESGWTEPIVVHSEELYIIDGEQRWTVAGHEDIQQNNELTPDGVPPGYVPVFGLDVDGDEARVSTVQHNRARGEVDVEEMDAYVETFDAEELADIGLSETEVFTLIDEDPTEQVEDVPDPMEDVDEVIEDSGGSRNPDPIDAPDPDSLSVVCSPGEERFIRAVIHDGETLDAYVDALEERGLVEDFRALVE